MNKEPVYLAAHAQIQASLVKKIREARKARGGTYLTALYNLHLPADTLSETNRKQLAYVVWLFLDVSNNLPTDTEGNGKTRTLEDAIWPKHLPLPEDFQLEPYAMGYLKHNPDGTRVIGADWWNGEDFRAFQHNYQLLRRCTERLIQGKGYGRFPIEEATWIDTKSQLIEYRTRCSFQTSSEMDSSFHTEKRLLSSVEAVRYVMQEHRIEPSPLLELLELDIVPSVRQGTPPSETLLVDAYLELFDAIKEGVKFRRCLAEATSERPACQNLFVAISQRGGEQKYCERCAIEIPKERDRQRKAQEREKKRQAQYKEWADLFANIPLGKQMDASQIANALWSYSDKRLTGRKTGRILGARLRDNWKPLLEKRHGITFICYHDGVQNQFTFKKSDNTRQ